MAILSLLTLYLNVPTKSFVSVAGSPTSVPPQFYGDKPTFQIVPVQPAAITAQGYIAYPLNGYTMNLTMAGAPNAQTPPTPFAAADGLIYVVPNSGFPYFQGTIDLTQAAVGTFIGNAPSMTAYFCVDCFDAGLLRTTLFQYTFSIQASIDTLNVAPPGPVNMYLTAAQIAALYLAIGAVPGKYCVWESPDGTKRRVQSLDNNGVEHFDPA